MWWLRPAGDRDLQDRNEERRPRRQQFVSEWHNIVLTL